MFVVERWIDAFLDAFLLKKSNQKPLLERLFVLRHKCHSSSPLHSLETANSCDQGASGKHFVESCGSFFPKLYDT